MRSKSGAARNQRKKRIFHRSKGFVGGRRRLLKSAKETLLRAGMFAFRDRRARKREFRKLFIVRISAAAEMRGLRYSRFIHGLHLARIGLDRKSLSELAIHDPQTFDTIVAKIQGELARHDTEVRAPEGQDRLRPYAVGPRGPTPPGPTDRIDQTHRIHEFERITLRRAG